MQTLYSVVKYACEMTVLNEENKCNFNIKVDKQKQIIKTYEKLLHDYLRGNLVKQVEAIYAMQVYASSKGYPKYLLAHLFNQMYDLEIIDEEAFYMWKDEINENYPDKGQALFSLQKWFSWLQEASEESSVDEDEPTTKSTSTIVSQTSASTTAATS
jgi:translation initiation factor 4G